MKKILIVLACLLIINTPVLAWRKAVPSLADDFYLDTANIYFYKNRYIFYWTKSATAPDKKEYSLFQMVSDCKKNKIFVNSIMFTDDQNNITLYGTNLINAKDLKESSFKEIGEKNILNKAVHSSLCTYYTKKGKIK